MRHAVQITLIRIDRKNVFISFRRTPVSQFESEVLIEVPNIPVALFGLSGLLPLFLGDDNDSMLLPVELIPK